MLIQEGDAFFVDLGSIREVHVVVDKNANRGDDPSPDQWSVMVTFSDCPDLAFTTYLVSSWNDWSRVDKWLKSGYTYLGGPERR